MLRPYAYAAIEFILPRLQKNSFNLIKDLGPVPERPISANTGLKFCSVFQFYLLCIASFVVTFCVIITISRSKGPTVQPYFVSLSCMLALHCLLKTWLNRP